MKMVITNASMSLCEALRDLIEANPNATIVTEILPDDPPKPPLQFPDPPEGKRWQNPEGLTPEQVQVDKGWRLLLKSEIKSQPFHGAFWRSSGKWSSSGTWGAYPTHTYRTLAPLPTKPVMVPLEPCDIAKMGTAIRKKEWDEGRCLYITELRATTVCAGQSYALGYDDLQKEYLIGHPEKGDWKRAEKEGK